MLDAHLQVARLTRELASHLLERAVITARHLDIGVTEVRAVEQLYLSGSMTSGELGRSLALTSGSVTALVNRLLKRGLVDRQVDENDRRRVRISVRADRVDEFLAAYATTIAGGQQIVERFSDADLTTVVRFLTAYRDASVLATGMLAGELPDNRTKNGRQPKLPASPEDPDA
ncbi:MarR family transcriptional regulator [Sphingomonas sp.]|uniref:MarR family winged helix-turn-helix transcriptional regulator n=1 Tax=Sphingomonas sp. TaxID=28214 RepID=UPI001EBEEA88|nr:MarR family transcriptional regulator [Sphingomonas sp.]MBX3595062.1 MarR family transcriptional regulator [Sphingomonas sp.]